MSSIQSDDAQEGPVGVVVFLANVAMLVGLAVLALG